MIFKFNDAKLAELYYKEIGIRDYPDSVVSAFFKKMQIIKNASNENDLRAIKGNHFEKLQGEDNKYSIRLNLQYRLIFQLGKENECTIILIEEISNHYS